MDYCTTCGAQRIPQRLFCSRCGSRYDAAAVPAAPKTENPETPEDALTSQEMDLGLPPPVPPSTDGWSTRSSTSWASSPPGHGPSWYVGVALALVAALAAVAVVVILWPHSSPNGTNAVLPRPSQPAPTPTEIASTEPTYPTETESPTPERSATPPIYEGNSVVSVAPAAGRDPTAPDVVKLLTRYFTDINDRDFADYPSLFVDEISAKFSRAQLERGYRSTVDSNARLASLTTGADGRPAATVTFISRQDAADGPDGQTCTRWRVTFFLESAFNGSYVFGRPSATYRARHSAC
jgi:hypothetical protein